MFQCGDEVSAAGDFNPTQFIAGFQRLTAAADLMLTCSSFETTKMDAVFKSRLQHQARFIGMNATMSHEEICKEIADELEDMARWLSGGELSPGQFRLVLNSLEKKKLERFGMKLSSTTSVDGVVHFSLRFAESDELCASMDVDPITGKLCTQLACG